MPSAEEHGVEVVVGDVPARERRRRERERRAVTPDADETDAALLHDLAGRTRRAAVLEPGVAAAERRMAGERQLAARGEDADAVVGGRVARREQEGRLAQVGPARERLHALVVEDVGAVHDGERIAAQRRAGEDVDLRESEAAHEVIGRSSVLRNERSARAV